ncbi:RnfABCDGE type electron transport complex subunit G [Shewanella dokdonensis]|uniref:Ion-translocating oxidoreductase complex subunit G n=1 Tax=Shewanella dokdonensis TaxID=712036 RepID=A0ABX8DH68_9GAMM|nr:RnfABCDGE type electron transport complex subunit G [Shewanella dokdonensis]MCL1074430.1 RnfABCDGE type electron transport complex subunit G [Shewanella dokdonensis]QVK24098.1 RnfABCDGE type electron transport complex subunit G [Shewanella dokdonensis]
MLAVIEKWKAGIPYQSLLLASICGVAAALLLLTDSLTKPLIAQRLEEDQNALLTEVLNGAPYANKVFSNAQQLQFAGSHYEMFPVKNAAGTVTHYVVRGTTEGYGGSISFLLGVDSNGVISGVRILSHSETPGLGDKIELAKSQWILSFNQHSLQNTALWAVKKDGGSFDQFAGATITPRAVVNGVHHAMQALMQQLPQAHPVEEATHGKQ